MIYVYLAQPASKNDTFFEVWAFESLKKIFNKQRFDKSLKENHASSFLCCPKHVQTLNKYDHTLLIPIINSSEIPNSPKKTLDLSQPEYLSGLPRSHSDIFVDVPREPCVNWSSKSRCCDMPLVFKKQPTYEVYYTPEN